MNLSEEQVRLLRDVVADLEEKVRRVRTPAGARRYGQPIGSVIVADAVPSVSSTPSAPKPRTSTSRSSLTRTQSRMLDKIRSSGTSDAAQVVHNAALDYYELASVADELDLNTVRKPDVVAVSRAIQQEASESLKKRGFPEEFSVWRTGPKNPSGVVSVTTREGGVRTFEGEVTEYRVLRHDILTDTDGFLKGAQTFFEDELHIDASNLKPVVSNSEEPIYDLDDEPVVGTISLLPEETPVVPLKPNNLIDGVAVTEYNGKQAWEDLRYTGDPSDGRLEMASAMTVNRVEGTEDEGRVFTDADEIQAYVDELLEEVGYGKRWISFTDNEDYLRNPDVKAAVSRGQTEMLDPEHPLYNKPVPVLIYRPRGISEFVLLHEVAHILEGCWKDPNHGDGHNWNWWETWGQLLKIRGLTVSRNTAQLFGASMEGMGVFDVA